MKYTLHHSEEMLELARTLAAELSSGQVWLLSGPLGAGKTTFVQALAQTLGVQEKVNSPSYTITAEYEVKHHPTVTKLVHVDLYRLNENAASDVAVRAVLEDVTQLGRLTVIEWAERLGSVNPAKRWSAAGREVKITFAHGSTPNERVVTVHTNGS